LTSARQDLLLLLVEVILHVSQLLLLLLLQAHGLGPEPLPQFIPLLLLVRRRPLAHLLLPLLLLAQQQQLLLLLLAQISQLLRELPLQPFPLLRKMHTQLLRLYHQRVCSRCGIVRHGSVRRAAHRWLLRQLPRGAPRRALRVRPGGGRRWSPRRATDHLLLQLGPGKRRSAAATRRCWRRRGNG